MKPLEYWHKWKTIYDARDTRTKFIPLEKIAKDPAKYGYAHKIHNLSDGYVSGAKQAAFLKDKAKIVIARCANRSGKSEAMVIKSLYNLESEKVNRNGRFWFLTESYDLQKDGIAPMIIRYFKPERIKNIEWERTGKIYKGFDYVNKHGIVIPVSFKTYEQREKKMQSAKLLGAAIDEEPPEAVFEEVRLRTTDLGGQLILAFAPLYGHTWTYHKLDKIGVKR